MNESFRTQYGPGVDSASNRNEYQEYFLGGKGGRCIGLTTLPLSCADCLRNLGASAYWNLKVLSRPVMGLLYLDIMFRKATDISGIALRDVWQFTLCTGTSTIIN